MEIFSGNRRLVGNESGTNQSRLRLVSYNILAQSKIKGPLYGYASPSTLGWNGRKKVIMDELISFNADVLCLQEVDNYDNWWRPQLQAAGYDGLFVKRGGRHKDGVATMFLRSKFQLFSSEVLDFNKVGEYLGETKPSSRLRQDNSGLIIGIQPWEKSDHPSALCISNVQLANPKNSDLVQVQRKQLLMLTRSIERFNSDFQLPVIVAGSFNLLPRDDHYILLTKGSFPTTLKIPNAIAERPTAESISRSQIRVSWKDIENPGDAPLTGFVVKRRVGGNSVFSQPVYFDGEATRSCCICGLASGLTYEFIVAGVSAVGIGDYSQPCCPIKTWTNSKNPATNIHLSHPTTAGVFTVHQTIETLKDWLDSDLNKDLSAVPKYEDHSLNLQVNPIRSRRGGKRDLTLVHTLGLQSAYGKYTGGNEPSFTVSTERFRGCVDYIFFSQEHFKVAKLLSVPLLSTELQPRTLAKNPESKSVDPRRKKFTSDLNDMKPNSWNDDKFSERNSFMGEWKPRDIENSSASHNWIPNERIPSDHISLMADFEFLNERLSSNWN